MKTWIADLLHSLAHWTGQNKGRVTSKTDSKGNIWIAFECYKCGSLTGKHIALHNNPTNKPQ